MKRFLDAPPEPMNIAEAIEAAKIINYFAPALLEHRNDPLIAQAQAILDSARQSGDDFQVTRLLTLMYHISIEELQSAYQTEDYNPFETATLILNGLMVSAPLDLLGLADLLGLKHYER